MGKSQARRLREAARRFGQDDPVRWNQAKKAIGRLIYKHKLNANLMPQAYSNPVLSGPHALIMRYSTSLSYQENQAAFWPSTSRR